MNWWYKYTMLLRVEWAVMMAYRSESLIWMIGSFIQPIVSLSVWLSITGNGVIGGYSAIDYVVYFIGVLVVERLTRSWDVWELDSEIRQGTLSAKLLRPFHPMHWSIAQNIVYKLFFAVLLIPAWLVLAWIWPALRPAAAADAGLMGLALLALLGSNILRYLTGYEFGMLAFWTNRATAIFALYEALHLFLAGRIAPLSMFPEPVALIASWFPFYSTVGFPVDLLTGKLAGRPDLIVQGFAQQAVWIMILIVIFRFQWKRGLAKYSAAGG
ncbi:ABC transporter permease [Paenibacillus puerhi]|uniref:ABC transporter permease n=1 Tax=Paenibacillus puerhi TaxID=2692622 RepID=UPI001359023A|nr:ABC-2 family transporter protein [Paenibacillus puerhi]